MAVGVAARTPATRFNLIGCCFHNGRRPTNLIGCLCLTQRYKPGRAAQLMESVSRALAQQLSLCLEDKVQNINVKLYEYFLFPRNA